jgi:alkylation response protein AidB-like acyl-CoA dehydrogenase
MFEQFKRSTLLWLVVAISLPAAAHGQSEGDQGTDGQKEFRSPQEALSFLQAEHLKDQTTFVIQGELDPLIRKKGVGGCASAAAIDLLQALRVAARREKLPNPHKVVLSSITKFPDLLEGPVSNELLVNVLNFYGQHLGELNLSIDVTCDATTDYRKDAPSWADDAPPKLAVKPGELTILSYTVTKQDGYRRGRHFVLLKHVEGDELTIVDPSRPAKDLRYVLKCEPEGDAEYGRVLLLNAPGTPARRESDDYELNTIITAKLSSADAPVAASEEDRDSVEYVKARFNRAASDLRSTPDWLSPRAWRKRTAAFGLPALDLPKAHGGRDWPASKMIEIFRHAGKYNLNFRDVVGGGHVRPLLKSSHPEVKEIVEQIARGDGYMAIAITEPDAGTDFAAMKSAAKKVEGGYLLTGEKRYNARLEQASHVIIFTQAANGEAKKLSAFVLPIDTPGLTVKSLSAHGLQGNSYGGLTFDKLFVPDSHLLGEDGGGMSVFFEHFLYWRLMQSAAAIGTGEEALDQMAERLKTRQVSGGPIGRFTHLQQPIGQHTTELRMAFALAKDVAQKLDDKPAGARIDAETRALICGIKAEGVEIALNAADAAARAFGGEGYSDRVDIGDRVRDLNGLRIADGTTDVMRMDVVRHIYGEEFWRMAIQSEE